VDDRVEISTLRRRPLEWNRVDPLTANLYSGLHPARIDAAERGPAEREVGWLIGMVRSTLAPTMIGPRLPSIRPTC
jgi:hypothetical protein